VISVNRVKVETIGAYRKEVEKVKEGDEIQLLLRRGRAGFIALTIVK
jgi:hypothetical protein